MPAGTRGEQLFPLKNVKAYGSRDEPREGGIDLESNRHQFYFAGADDLFFDFGMDSCEIRLEAVAENDGQ
jgi:hypothetical protein